VSRLPGSARPVRCVRGVRSRQTQRRPGWPRLGWSRQAQPFRARPRQARPRQAPPRQAPPRQARPGLRLSATAVALAAVGAMVLAGCAGEGIAQNTPASNGQSFVSGSSGTTVFKAGAGPVAPAVTGMALGGTKLSLTAYRGNVVVMNFWGSWCTPCRAEAPALAALARYFRPSGVQFLGVDIRDSPASAEAFMHDFGIQYPSLNDPADEIALDFRSTVPPEGIPTTLVIARSGRISARVIGETSYNGLRGLIARAAAEPS
jgi:peroxiredoxin